MKTTTSYPTDTTVLLTITVGKTELDAAEKVALLKLAKSIKVPGFRAGKVPASVAAKHVDPNALSQQTLEDALSKAVADAFVGEKIQVLDRPAVEVKKFVPGVELEFTAEAEVLPKIKLGDYKNLKVVKAKATVVKKDIDDVIERMRSGFAEKKPVERAAKKGDEVVIDFVGKKDDVPFDGGIGSDYPLTLGSNSFIPGFEDGIIGKKKGETFDLKLSFPEDYHVPSLKGQKVVFTTTVKKVNEVVLPEVNDEFARKSGQGFETVKDLEADIKRELTAGKEREALESFKDDLVKALVEASEAPVPEILLKDQAQSIEQDMMQNLMYQGLSIDQYLEQKGFTKEKWQQTEVRDAAEKRVQAGLVLAELSKVEKIDATSEELDKHVAEYKERYGKNPEALKSFDSPEGRQQIANRLLTEKTVDRLVELNSKK